MKKTSISGLIDDTMPRNTLELYFDANTVNLEFVPAKVLDVQDQTPVLTYTVYQTYFSERDFEESRFLSKVVRKCLLFNTLLLIFFPILLHLKS